MYTTGYCNTGSHEGKSPLSMSGKPMKVCTAYDVCECSCHTKFNKMYKMANEERRPHPNPRYVPARSIDLSDILTRDRLLDADALGGVVRSTTFDEQPSETAAGLPESAREWTPRPDGRRQRGQLEAEVQAICNRGMMGEFDKPLTPQFVSDLVGGSQQPSVGAIGAVFDRWEKIGYAAIARKPVYFRHFTPIGMRNGLEEMKRLHEKGVKQ